MEELIKHPKKTKPFSRKNVMDFAKVIRNANISNASRSVILKDLAEYLASEDPFFDKPMFTGIATGKYESDFRTRKHSKIQEKHNGIV